jgi:phage portal protein BeeE
MNDGETDVFNDVVPPKHLDPFMFHAWVNIAVDVLIRNVARASFVVRRGGEDVNSGKLYELFRRPNENMSCYDLWKETAGWRALEGEAFWWFGAAYSGGIPKEIFVLNPRNMRHEQQRHQCDGASRHCRWYYQTDMGDVPILGDELIHFRNWNPWNSVRGVNPLIALSFELEQDYYANKANSELLKNNAIPVAVATQIWRPKTYTIARRDYKARWQDSVT